MIQKAPSVPRAELQFVFVVHLQWMDDKKVDRIKSSSVPQLA